jgi:hypothetical protein
MAVIINGASIPQEPIPPKKRRSGHTEPKWPDFSLDEPGRKVRTAHFQWFMGQMSHSAFLARRKRERVPEPDGHDPRPFWWTETVKDFLQHLTRRPWERFPDRLI